MLKKLIAMIIKSKGQKSHIYSVDKDNCEIFQYDFIRTFDKLSTDYMIRFHFVKNASQLIGMLLILIDDLGFEAGKVKDVWMNDEIWITARSINGQIVITRDNYDFVFIMGTNNKADLDRIENTMSNSANFKRIIVNEEK